MKWPLDVPFEEGSIKSFITIGGIYNESFIGFRYAKRFDEKT